MREPDISPDTRVLNRIRAEYTEMPGLSLNRAQAQRLFAVDPETCSRLLDTLVEEGFLCRTDRGTYVRLPGAIAGTAVAKADLRPGFPEGVRGFREDRGRRAATVRPPPSEASR